MWKVIEIGCEAYEPMVGKPGWIGYSNEVSLQEAIRIKKEANEWRKKQGVKEITYHIWDMKEPINDFVKRVSK